MLFTCPGAAARGGIAPTARGARRHFCIDIHCHVINPAVDEMVKHVFAPEREPAMKFSNALTRETNRRQNENIWACLTTVEQRLRDMDKMGVDVQAISSSPAQFMYWLEPDLGARTARAVNENLASIVARHPDRFVALANVPLQSADAAAEELEYCIRRLGFRGVEIGTNVDGREVSRGLDKFWAKVQELGVMVFMHPNGFTGAERLSDHYFNNVIGNPLDTTVAVAHLVFDGVLERFPKLKIVSAHGGGYIAHYPARMDHVWGARVDARTQLKKEPRQSLAKLYFDTIVFDRDQLRHLVNLWGADHILVGTDYPYDMGWYDPHGFVDGCGFLKDPDRAAIKGLNAAKLLGITGRLKSMGIRPAGAGAKTKARSKAKGAKR
ncbi:MAG: amidohydrolase [Betaproteobacteria bacterium]|jgi:aminocarboxymuconate-semialdehyde decarboxylase|nr:amidohydrolase [Betaproteobacteria bacterium]